MSFVEWEVSYKCGTAGYCMAGWTVSFMGGEFHPGEIILDCLIV